MTKTFLRLYALLVLAIIGTGYGLDRLWQSYLAKNWQDQTEPEQLLTLASAYLQTQATADWPQQLQRLNRQFSDRLSLVSASSFSATDDITARLQRGETVALSGDGDARISVQQLNDPNWLLLDTLPTGGLQRRVEVLLLVAFYLFIAVVVLLWVWPLSRALRQLEIAAEAFGMGDWSAKAEVKPGSAVAPLAKAFNQMAARIAELIRSNKELSHAISHELRTPLARMKFALAMAGESQTPNPHGDDANLKRNLDSLAQDVAEMDALVNELLQFASFERNERALDQQYGDLRALLNDKLAQLPQRDGRTLQLSLDCQLSDGMAYCDFHLLERAVQNLLLNASRYARSRIALHLTLQDGFYQLCVDDDGPGVPASERERIFEAFVRLDDRNQHGAGFGLGLAIVQRIAEWHGGKVSVTTAPLGGARFLLQWPAPAERGRTALDARMD